MTLERQHLVEKINQNMEISNSQVSQFKTELSYKDSQIEKV